MAYAGSRFVSSLLKAMVLKEKGIVECSYVKSDVKEGLEYFSTKVELGPEGVSKIFPIPTLDEHEQKLMAACIPELKSSIEKGIQFVAKVSSA